MEDRTLKIPSATAAIKAIEPNVPQPILDQIKCLEPPIASIMGHIVKESSINSQKSDVYAPCLDEIIEQVQYTNGKVRAHTSQIEAMLEGFTFYLRCKKVMFWALPIMGIATLTFFGLLVKELGVVKMIEIAAASIFGSHE